MRDSLSALRRGVRSLTSLPWKTIVIFLLTIPFILLVCYAPLTFMAKDRCTGTIVSTDYWDRILLEFEPSERGDIYRFILKVDTDLTDDEEVALARIIYDESQKYDCDPKLVLAVIMVESSFDSKAISHKGARGLMQLLPYVARAMADEVGIEWSEETIIYDPEVNVRLGLYYLSRLILDFKDIRIALAAYNFGPTYIKERMKAGNPLPVQYADKVLHHYERLSQKEPT